MKKTKSSLPSVTAAASAAENSATLDRGKKALAFIAAAIIIIFAFWLVVRPKSEFSQNENRYLQQWPKLSVSALASGSYLSDIDDYLADHFPLRDFFVTVNTKFALLLGKTEINEVYLADDGYLIEKYKQPERTELITKAFNRLDENLSDSDLTLMLVPTAITVYSQLLPYGSSDPSQLEEIEKIYTNFNSNTADAASVLFEYKDEYQLFYRTDHHWTSRGAYCGYLALCASLGLEPKNIEEYSDEIVNEDFKGTIYSKVNDYSIDGDPIELFTDESWDIAVDYEDTGEISNSPFEMRYLGQKDKYSLFLNNIHPLVVITNNNAKSESELAVVKDSYANCLVPFLINHFSKIYVFDTRYYPDDVSKFINAHENITETVIIYNMNTIDSDTGATKIR